MAHDESRQHPGRPAPRTLPRLIALERSSEYICWGVVLPNHGALTCEIAGPPRPVLWDTLDDALDHYGAGVTVDTDPLRHVPPGLSWAVATGGEGPLSLDRSGW